MIERFTDFFAAVKPSDAEKFFLGIGGFLGAVFTFAVGGLDNGIIWLITLCVIDYITGVVAAFWNGKWCSRTGFQGLFKKFFIFVVVSLCAGLDVVAHVDLLRNMAIFGYAVNEAGSIVENVDKLGLGGYIPAFLRKGLKQLKEKSDL